MPVGGTVHLIKLFVLLDLGKGPVRQALLFIAAHDTINAEWVLIVEALSRAHPFGPAF